MAITGGATFPRRRLKRPVASIGPRAGTRPTIGRPASPRLRQRNMAANMNANAQAQAQAQRQRELQARHQAAPSPTLVQANSNQPAAPAPLADPRDSRYYMELAAGQGGMNNQVAQLQFVSKTDKAALGERLRLLSEREPIERQNATNDANLQGLLYSGALGRQQGDIGLDFLRQRTDAQTAFDADEAQRQMQIADLQRAWGDGGTEVWRLLQEAAERASERDMNAPLTTPAGPKKTGPGRPKGGSVKPTTQVQRIQARADRYAAKGNTRAATTLRKRASKLAGKG